MGPTFPHSKLDGGEPEDLKRQIQVDGILDNPSNVRRSTVDLAGIGHRWIGRPGGRVKGGGGVRTCQRLANSHTGTYKAASGKGWADPGG